MQEVTIQAVCGFGCGSSLFLRMKMEEILEKHGLSARVFCGDVGTCVSAKCDAIFISEELSDRIIDRAKMPVVIINNFMDSKEVEEKLLAFFETVK